MTDFNINSWLLLFSDNRELALLTLTSSLAGKTLSISDEDLCSVWCKLDDFEKMKFVSQANVKAAFKRITKDTLILNRIRYEFKAKGKLAAAKLYKQITGCGLKTAVDYGIDNNIW